MHFNIITVFKNIFSAKGGSASGGDSFGYLSESIIGRAIKNKLISVKFYNPRDFIKASKNNYKPVDDKPYGGGPGMVMRAEPILKTVEKVLKKIKSKKILIINFIPSAEKFTTTFAKIISKKYTDIILICGRYEGIDARVDKILKTKKLSIGDYVLTGGEIPAMILVDCVSRQIPGVLGKYESLEEERISSSEVYTRPEIFKYKNKNYKVPKVLLSGNHKLIENWKQKK